MSFNVTLPAASVIAEILRRGSSVLCNHVRALRSGTLPAIFITTPEIVPKSSLGDFASVCPRAAAPASNTISSKHTTLSISAGVYAELRTDYILQLHRHPKNWRGNVMGPLPPRHELQVLTKALPGVSQVHEVEFRKWANNDKISCENRGSSPHVFHRCRHRLDCDLSIR